MKEGKLGIAFTGSGFVARFQFRPDTLDTYVPLVAQGLWKGR